jgi:hypothetical protein
MVYIPFPRQDQDEHLDLKAWREKQNKTKSDWKSLKPFLAEQPRLIKGNDRSPKCWYTELPQGDNYALDVEHFRPKNQALPLKEDTLKILGKIRSNIYYSKCLTSLFTSQAKLRKAQLLSVKQGLVRAYSPLDERRVFD